MTIDAPEGWSKATVEGVSSILDSERIPLNSEQRRQRSGKIPYWGANGIVDYIDDYIFDEPLLLMAEDGGYFNEARTRPICQLIDGKSWVNNHAHVLRVNTDQSRLWVYYWFVNRDITKHINGSTRSKLNQKDLKALSIYLPPLHEQKKITEVLSSVDEAIAATKAVIDQTKQVKKGLLQTLLTKGIGHTKFKPSPLGDIPAAWEVVSVDCIKSSERYSCVGGPFGSDLTSKHFVESPDEPVIRGCNLSKSDPKFIDDGFVYVSSKKADQLIKSMAYPGDILFTQRGTLGQVGLIPENSKHSRYIVSQSQMKLTPDSQRADANFIYQYFSSNLGQSLISREAIGTGVPHINLSILKKLIVLLPSIEEQKQISQIAEAYDEEISLSKKTLAQLQTLKSGLMSDLLTGRVRVKVLTL